MTIDLKAIRVAAEAATPEPWIQSGVGNMPFICMMTPATVIALLNRLEAAEEKVKELERELQFQSFK